MDGSRKTFLELRDQLRWRVSIGLAGVTTVLMLGLVPLNASLGLQAASQIAGITGLLGVILLGVMWRAPRRLGMQLAFSAFAFLIVSAMAYGAWRGYPIHYWGLLFPPLIVFLLRPRLAAIAMAGFGLYALLVNLPLLSTLEVIRFVSIYLLLAGFVTTFALLEEEAGLALARESEGAQQLQRLLEASLDAVIMMDGEGRVAGWNAAAERIFGWRSGEIIGQVLSEHIIPHRYREAHESGMRRFLATGEARVLGKTLELAALHREGREFPVELSLWHVRTATGTLFGALMRDISARKAAERQLREQEEKYRSVVENGSEGILVAAGGRVMYANPFMERTTGRALDTLLGQPFTAFIHPDDIGKVVDNYQRRLRGEPVEQHYEFRVLAVDGRVVWMELSAVAIEWEGQPATLSFLTDVTQRRALQEQLRAKTREQEVILQSTVIGIALIQSQRLQWANSTLESMLGYAQGALLGQPVGMLFKAERDWTEFLPGVMATLDATGAYTGELELLRSDGQPIWVQVHGSRLPPGDGPPKSLWTFIDITERKRAETELLNALSREREFGQLKSRFVSMTSHEFRTPLAGIQSSVDLVANYGDRLEADEKREIFQQIRDSVGRMTRMLDNILLIGRGDAQTLRFAPAPTDLAALCRQLQNEVTQSRPADGRRADVVLDLDGIEGEWQLDTNLLRHSLGNLLSNAVKYSPDGGDVRFCVRVDGDMLCFEVADQGIGIPEADQQRLFDSFHRASNVGNIEGTGLGLAIVKQSTELHGGRISVQSSPGVGTTFTVQIPSARVS